MFKRLTRIGHEFGTKDFAKVLFLLAALVVMSAAGLVFLKSPWTALTAVAGLGVGWLLRGAIVDNMETLFRISPTFLFLYGIGLTAGQLLGLSHEGQLVIITATTAILFNIQFWPLSDPGIVNIEKA